MFCKREQFICSFACEQLRNSSARVVGWQDTHRGARTHDHKVKGALPTELGGLKDMCFEWLTYTALILHAAVGEWFCPTKIHAMVMHACHREFSFAFVRIGSQTPGLQHLSNVSAARKGNHVGHFLQGREFGGVAYVEPSLGSKVPCLYGLCMASKFLRVDEPASR